MRERARSNRLPISSPKAVNSNIARYRARLRSHLFDQFNTVKPRLADVGYDRQAAQQQP
jgi:hypothetical protein